MPQTRHHGTPTPSIRNDSVRLGTDGAGIVLLLLAALAGAPAARADRLVLENGSIFHGTLVEETASQVTFRTDLGTLTFPRTRVRSIDRIARQPPADPGAPAEAPRRPGPPRDETGGSAAPGRRDPEPPSEPRSRAPKPGSLDALRQEIRLSHGDVEVLQRCLDTLETGAGKEEQRRLDRRNLLEEATSAFRAIANRDRTAAKAVALARFVESHRAAFGEDFAGWFRDVVEAYLDVLSLDESHGEAYDALRGLIQKHRAWLEGVERRRTSDNEPPTREITPPAFSGLPSEEREDGRVRLYRAGDLDNEISFAFRQRTEKAESGSARFRWQKSAASGWSYDALPPPGGGSVTEIWMCRVTIRGDIYIETYGPHGLGRIDVKDHTWIELRWDADLRVWTFPTRAMIRKWIAGRLVEAGQQVRGAQTEREASAAGVDRKREELERLYETAESGLSRREPAAFRAPLRSIASVTYAREEAQQRSIRDAMATGGKTDQLARWIQTYVRYGGTEAEARAAAAGVWMPEDR